MSDRAAGPPDAVDRAIGVLIVAVRAQAFAEVRGVVVDSTSCCGSCGDVGEKILRALDALEGK